jgi:hypothetical protein
MTHTAKNLMTAAGLASALLFSVAAQAEMLTFKADMLGATEVPATDSAGKGTAELTVDTDAKKVSWTMSVDGLTGEATAAHTHGPASATETAPPVIDMSGAMMMKGSADITDAQLADMKAGKYYVNVHTAKFPDGEIRGQLAAK